MPSFPPLLSVSSTVWQKWRKLMKLTLGIRSTMPPSQFQCPSVILYDEQLKKTTPQLGGCSEGQWWLHCYRYCLRAWQEGVEGWCCWIDRQMLRISWNFCRSLFHFLCNVIISFSTWLTTCETKHIMGEFTQNRVVAGEDLLTWYFWFTLLNF